MPKKPIIDKEMFKRSVLYNVKTLYRKTLEEATDQQIFQAVAYAVKDAIVDHWLKTQAAYEEKDPKTVYYMSMEFLMGRALGNNMINLMAYKEFSEALEELGLDINVIEDQEPDAALGNGGLGRLAAYVIESVSAEYFCKQIFYFFKHKLTFIFIFALFKRFLYLQANRSAISRGRRGLG